MILSDESTGNLDNQTAQIIFEYLVKFAKEKLVIVVSHDTKSAFKYVDRILEISEGTIIKDLSKKNG
ncbi:hypothetical protein J8J04_00965 ['Fragaria x ananassa' phyllody phytoplasma]|uniref:ABC transporter ATP-binding protein n=1 Tax='Fragaria x ananassa' phyllody phytoplasma TaxID=2358428 RepID=A0ABS5K335_9MOLU|nr:hypothetical protein ['Fragaria x ananassa' phyllody phytoplasma]MBS2126273.1 hypothetical protein ['Fragaria x ananassa' phyllody phytoplasma]